MKTTTKRALLLLAMMLLCLALLAACGGGAAQEAAEEEAAAEETAQDLDFLLGSWFAETATKDGTTVDAYDVFGDTFSLYFDDDGECTMWVGQDHALVKWELTDDGVLLTGDNTYPCTFLDEGRTTMNIVINGIDVLMNKYEE